MATDRSPLRNGLLLLNIVYWPGLLWNAFCFFQGKKNYSSRVFFTVRVKMRKTNWPTPKWRLLSMGALRRIKRTSTNLLNRYRRVHINSCLFCFINLYQNFPKPPPVGSRVRRGDDWKYGNQDGGSAGTVTKTDGTPGQFRHQQTLYFYLILVILGEDVSSITSIILSRRFR